MGLFCGWCCTKTSWFFLETIRAPHRTTGGKKEACGPCSAPSPLGGSRTSGLEPVALKRPHRLELHMLDQEEARRWSGPIPKALGAAAPSRHRCSPFKAALSGCSHMISVSPSECGRALEMETSRDQDGNCSKEGRTSKHLFIRQPPNGSQIAETRPSHRVNKDVLFTCFFPLYAC